MTHNKETYHKQREILLDKLGARCEHCSSKTRLEFHTIDGSGESGCGGWKKLYLVKVNMEKGNIQLLCHDCHVAHHTKYGFNKNQYQVNFVGVQNDSDQY